MTCLLMHQQGFELALEAATQSCFPLSLRAKRRETLLPNRLCAPSIVGIDWDALH